MNCDGEKMQITKVEEIDNGEYKVHIEHNGMCAYYFLEESLNPLFMKELEIFKKTFFDLGEVSWTECDVPILEIFTEFSILHNEDVDKEIEKLGDNK